MPTSASSVARTASSSPPFGLSMTTFKRSWLILSSASSPFGPGAPVTSGASVGAMSMRAGRVGSTDWSCGMKAESRPAVSGMGCPVPRRSISPMEVTSRPHSTIERRSWLKPEVEMPSPTS